MGQLLQVRTAAAVELVECCTRPESTTAQAAIRLQLELVVVLVLKEITRSSTSTRRLAAVAAEIPPMEPLRSVGMVVPEVERLATVVAAVLLTAALERVVKVTRGAALLVQIMWVAAAVEQEL